MTLLHTTTPTAFGYDKYVRTANTFTLGVITITFKFDDRGGYDVREIDTLRGELGNGIFSRFSKSHLELFLKLKTCFTLRFKFKIKSPVMALSMKVNYSPGFYHRLVC